MGHITQYISISLKLAIHEATFVVGDMATLLFVRAVHGNIAWYILQVTWK